MYCGKFSNCKCLLLLLWQYSKQTVKICVIFLICPFQQNMLWRNLTVCQSLWSSPSLHPRVPLCVEAQVSPERDVQVQTGLSKYSTQQQQGTPPPYPPNPQINWWTQIVVHMHRGRSCSAKHVGDGFHAIQNPSVASVPQAHTQPGRTNGIYRGLNKVNKWTIAFAKKNWTIKTNRNDSFFHVFEQTYTPSVCVQRPLERTIHKVTLQSVWPTIPVDYW